MQAILSMIYCFLLDMIATFRDVGIESWDSVLGVLDATLGAIGTGGLVLPIIPAEYTWMLGATGMSQALTIVAGAMGVRFLLQTVPFVRWGS
jgi:putative flippase GtrA